jgi:hypothetical protein
VFGRIINFFGGSSRKQLSLVSFSLKACHWFVSRKKINGSGPRFVFESEVQRGSCKTVPLSLETNIETFFAKILISIAHMYYVCLHNTYIADENVRKNSNPAHPPHDQLF